MIKKIINKIWKPEGQDELHTPTNEDASFELMYETLPIGTLEVHNGLWKFSYSKEFKLQHEVNPLVDFPDVNKVYESSQLWPFFSYRIPGLSQPSVKAIIEKEDIDKTNSIQLLKKFGAFSVYNPYVLKPLF